MMTFDYTLLKLDTGKYMQIVNKELIEDLKAGGALWLNKCLSIIPVWSGASHGTFLKIAAEIGRSISVATRTSMPGVGGPAAGSAASSASMEASKGTYTLTYTTSLWHLVYNEYTNANNDPKAGRLFARLIKPGPYNFQEQGGAVFKSFAERVRLPSPWKALTLQKKRV